MTQETAAASSAKKAKDRKTQGPTSPEQFVVITASHEPGVSATVSHGPEQRRSRPVQHHQGQTAAATAQG